MQSPALPDRPRRRPLGLVVRDEASEEATPALDWSSWYLTDEDDMGEGTEQSETIRIFLSVLLTLAREEGWSDRLCGGDAFFAWVKDEPLVRVSPDVYILENPPPAPWPASWQTWLPGHSPPRFAVEVVSTDWRKDYDDNPAKYWQLGCEELVLFDPAVVTRSSEDDRERGRVPLQVYRREADGALVRVYAGTGPVQSRYLGLWLVVWSDGAVARLRLARRPFGGELVPTEAEAGAMAEARARTEAAARTAAEARAGAAEERVAALEAQLRALGGATKPPEG